MSISRSLQVVARLCLFILMAAGLTYQPAAAQQTENNAQVAAQTLAQINDWRTSQGLWPLAVNPTLEAIAYAQANYILPLLSSVADESAYHLDAQRRNPRQRGLLAGWPLYDTNPEHIEVGENAGVGTLTFIMNFWKGSSIHSKAALSTTYREIGVAALPRAKGGYLIYTVFGARPAVLPALVTADGTKLYLTEEKSRYAGASTPTTVQLLDEAGNALTDAVPWKAQLELPAGVGNVVSVQYSYGSKQTTTVVNRAQAVALLTSTLGQVTAPVQVVAATPQTAAVQPTAAPIEPTAAPVQGAQPTAASVQPTTAPLQPTAVPAQPAVNRATADLLITYDWTSLNVINNSANPLNLTGLSLIGSGVTVGVQLWSRVGDVPVTAFPSSHCMMVRLINSGAAVPATCKWTRSIVDLTGQKLFWTMGDFIVSVNGTQLATCPANAGQCAVDVP